MDRKYSFSIPPTLSEMSELSPCLAVDTGSPVVSVGVAIAGEIVASRSAAGRNASTSLLGWIDDVLARAGIRSTEVRLLLGQRGPGSFTGLRVGLATLTGLQMAWGIPAATFDTFEVLASQAPLDDREIVACVDALKGHWLIQRFAADSDRSPIGAPELVTSSTLVATGPSHMVGFGVSGLDPGSDSESTPNRIEPAPLAPAALTWALRSVPNFDPATLSEPLYLQPPAAKRLSMSG